MDDAAFGGFVPQRSQFLKFGNGGLLVAAGDGCAETLLLAFGTGNDGAVPRGAGDGLAGAFSGGFRVGHKDSEKLRDAHLMEKQGRVKDENRLPGFL